MKIKLTQSDLDTAKPGDCKNCLFSQAFKRILGSSKIITSLDDTKGITYSCDEQAGKMYIGTPRSYLWAKTFDYGNLDLRNVDDYPEFEFTIKPMNSVIRGGKKLYEFEKFGKPNPT